MIEVAPRVWLLPGFPRFFVNAYLAEDVLIDAATRWDRGRIDTRLRNRPPSLVALTHCHPDHQGTAHWACARYGIPLACHEADADVMEGRTPVRPDRFLVRLAHRLASGPPRKVDQVLRGGEVIARFRVVPTPGHTPGHVCFFRESDGVLLAGDVLVHMNLITGEPGLYEPIRVGTVDRRLNQQSILKVRDLRPSLICFGHGPPLRDMKRLDRFIETRGFRDG
jgi:hydroxyacylglutathione hydrolase